MNGQETMSEVGLTSRAPWLGWARSEGRSWQGHERLDTALWVELEGRWGWARPWAVAAEGQRREAERAEARGQRRRAGEAWMRASRYYRAALHRHPEPSDPDAPRLAMRAVLGFHRGLKLLELPAQAVRIPYEGTTLPGYFFRAPGVRERAPVRIVVHPGRDAWAEDGRYLAEEALQRGSHCLLFDGPGQGKALWLQGLPARPDGEHVVALAVDFAREQRGVDPERISLVRVGEHGPLERATPPLEWT